MKNNSVLPNGEVKIEVSGLWKIFGPRAQQIADSITDGVSKEDVYNQSGHVIGVRDASFKVHQGEFFVIMGLSGCGKSVMVRCVNRLLKPTKGQVFIEGEELGSMDEVRLREIRRKKMSMVFQLYGLFPHRNILDNVAYGLEVQKVGKEERRERALQAIKKVELAEWKDMHPNEMSGGMQQRAGLARALLVDTEILLMDEPFSGLDPLIRRQMQDDLVKLLAGAGKTVVFITHDLNEAVKLGDTIAVMRDGAIIQIGTPEEIVLTPADDYITEFVRDVPRVKVLTAGNIMEQPNVLIYEGQRPEAAIDMLKTAKLDDAFLVTSAGKLLGLVTVDRLAELLRRNGSSLSEALEPNLPICTTDMLVEDLFPLAASTSYPVPVVDDTGKFTGEIHTSTILGSMIGEKEAGADA